MSMFEMLKKGNTAVKQQADRISFVEATPLSTFSDINMIEEARLYRSIAKQSTDADASAPLSWNNTGDNITGMPNFMPYSAQFQSTEMYENIIKRIPTIKVAQLGVFNLSESILLLLRSALVDTDSAIYKQFIVNVNTSVGEEALKAYKATESAPAIDKLTKQFTPLGFEELAGGDGKGKEVAIALMFGMFMSRTVNRYVFPIMSSPNIIVKTGAGWEKAQSIFPLVTKLMGAVGLKETTSLAKGLSSIFEYLGKNIYVGPLFSTTNLTENKPSFVCTTYLVNDSFKAAAKNKNILSRLLIGTLPAATQGTNIRPGALFNVSVDIGIGINDKNGTNTVTPIKKLYLCTAEFNVKTHGIYRDGVTPEIYELTTTFESLLPDLMNMQLFNYETECNNGTDLLNISTEKWNLKAAVDAVGR